MPQTDKLLSLENAAKQLGCEPKFLKNSALSGEIPFSDSGERMMFEPNALDDWFSNIMVRNPHSRKIPSQTINLVDLCRPEAISIALEGKTKTAILKNLTELCEKTGLLYDAEEFYQELRKREEISSTAMTQGIALVHTRNHDEFLCEEPFIAIARTPQPIFFGEPDGHPTDIFFVIAAQDSTTHIKILAQLCRAIAATTLVEDIRNAEDEAGILDALSAAMKRIEETLQ